MKTLLSFLLLFCIPASLFSGPNMPPRSADEKIIETCTEIRRHETRIPGVLEAWGERGKFWPAGSTLRVKFLNGSAGQKDKAWSRFQTIDRLVNLSFKRVETGAAEIRVRFDGNAGHWSYVGRDCLGIPSAQPTMNLALRSGWLNGDGPDEWDRVGLHEILHAIGLYHEHQHPQAAIPWNEAAVIDYYKRTQGWSEQEIRFQVLNREPMTKGFVGTRFDPQSIMEYPVPRELTTNGFSVGWNRQLSVLDFQFLQQVYPIAKGI